MRSRRGRCCRAHVDRRCQTVDATPPRASALALQRPDAWQHRSQRDTVMRRNVYARWFIWGIMLSSLGLHAGSSAGAAEKTVVHWWHAMSGQLEDAVEVLAQQFNASQPTYEVRSWYTGTYAETLTAALAASQAYHFPHLVQVFEVGTQIMLLSGGVYPVYQLMQDHQI